MNENLIKLLSGNKLLINNVNTASVAAYSLRRVNKYYVGALIRVRRSTDNAEMDIYYDSYNNLAGDSLLAFCGAGSGYVSVWYDQSGNGKHAVQSTTTAQPLIVDSGNLNTINNRATIYCDGNRYLTVSGAIIFKSFSAITNWTLGESFTAWRGFLGQVSSGVVFGEGQNLLAASGTMYTNTVNTPIYAPMANLKNNVGLWGFNMSLAALRLGIGDSAANGWVGNISEIILYYPSITSSEINAIFTENKNYYNLEV